VQAAIAQGMADAWTDLATLKKEKLDTGQLDRATCSAPRLPEE